jgi:hypothetical protein
VSTTPGPTGPTGGAGGGSSDPTPPQGRLTLQTAMPVMTATQSAKTTIYYTPYVGNKVPIYDGTNMVMTTFAELSVATTDTTKSPAAIGASKVNDWFVWNDAGTIRLGHGPDWTSDIARSAGTALTMANGGIWLNNAAITNGPAASRGTYVGTTRSNASSQLDWILPVIGAPPTAGVFNVWNAYNRVEVAGTVGDTTATWTVSASLREFRGNTTYEIRFVTGLQEDAVTMHIQASATAEASTGNYLIFGFGIDSITATTGPRSNGVNQSNLFGPATTTYATTFLGYHYIAPLESTSGGAGTTLYGPYNAMTVRLRM